MTTEASAATDSPQAVSPDRRAPAPLRPGRSGPLARPAALLTVGVSSGVAVHVGALRLSPLIPLLIVVMAWVLLRSRRSRRAFGPFTRSVIALFAGVMAFFSFPPFAHGRSLLDLLNAVVLAVMLTPLFVVSLRARSTGNALAIDASRRRSPWVVAAGLVPALTEFIRDSELAVTPEPNEGFAHAGGPLLSIYAAATAIVLALTVADLRALRHARGIDRQRAPLRSSRSVAPLLRSVILDGLALALAVAPAVGLAERLAVYPPAMRHVSAQRR
ncbi:MAG TPA: hypothetical protein VEK07_07255 [Polyangiaceae bacterium]|nr:hypothetical protein [Polyangiaceae bacterium]